MNKNELKSKLQDLEEASFSKVLSFLKTTNCYSFSRRNRACELFWQSKLPLKWFNELIEEPFLDDFLFGYFSKDENANDNFIKQLINSKKKSTLIRVVKLTEAFTKPNHWKSFLIFKNSIELKRFYVELKYVRDYRQYWKIESDKYFKYIDNIDYEDILIQTISYFEQFKRYSEKTKNNRTLLVSYESHLHSILNTILNLKKESYLKDKTTISNKYSSDEFKEYSNKELPVIRPVESFLNPLLIPVENISEQKARFRKLVEFLFAKDDNEYQIKKYLTGLADFELIDGFDSELTTNSKHNLYRNTLEKGIYDEVYFTNRVIEDSKRLSEIKKLPSLWEKQFKLNIDSSLEYFNFLKIPTVINDKHSKTEINLEKILLFLKTFTTFLMPQGRIILQGKESLKRDLPLSFQKLFYSGYIVCLDETELINKCQEYFNWSKTEIQIIIDFLTTDLNSSRKFKIDFIKRPLIKIGNQYIWLSSFLRDRRWEIVLHQRIVADNSKNLISQPANTEKYVSEIFIEADFGSISSYCYEYKDLKGEIDVLAFKDNTLFVFELKTTYVEEDLMKTSKYETLKFNSKASEQLSKAKDFILNNFEKLKAIEELNINCKEEDLKTVTIIISNIYQADNLIFNNEHLKISLFELLIILKNDLYNMLVSKISEALFDSELEFSIDSILKKHDTPIQINVKDCNLLKDIKNCTSNDIISAIKENKVWKHQDTNKTNTIENIDLTTFNENHKYLN